MSKPKLFSLWFPPSLPLPWILNWSWHLSENMCLALSENGRVMVDDYLYLLGQRAPVTTCTWNKDATLVAGGCTVCKTPLFFIDAQPNSVIHLHFFPYNWIYLSLEALYRYWHLLSSSSCNWSCHRLSSTFCNWSHVFDHFFDLIFYFLETRLVYFLRNCWGYRFSEHVLIENISGWQHQTVEPRLTWGTWTFLALLRFRYPFFSVSFLWLVVVFFFF